jgi:hypothetical protein
MPASDFDFLPGHWDVVNHRLVDGEWQTFHASSHAEAMLGGTGNLDHFHAPGYEGFSLRLHDPERDVWRIWWSSTARPGRLDPPVEGRFEADGTATFEADDVLDGVPLRVRFRWSEITGDAACWDQWFSHDAGRTWEHNWTMLLTRAAPPGSGSAAP